MDPRRYLCPDCRPSDELDDFAEMVTGADSFSLGQHVCVVCDRTFSADPIVRPPWLADREGLPS